MPYVLQDRPDEEVEVWVGIGRLRTISPLATLAYSEDEDVRAHIFRDEGCFSLIVPNAAGEYVVTPHWFREAAEALANLVVAESGPEPTRSPPDGVPGHLQVGDSPQGAMVYITEVGPKKINILKGIRQMKDTSLREAKQIVDSISERSPYYLGSSLPADWVEYLHAHGATTKCVLAPTVWEHLHEDD